MSLMRLGLLSPLRGALLMALAACASQDGPPIDSVAHRDTAPADTGPQVIGCSADARPGLQVAVRDAATGAALGGYTVVLRADSTGPRSALDSVTVPTADVWGGALEQAGRFAVRVTKPGYHTWDSAGIVVSRDRCHVILRRLDVLLRPM